METKVTQHTPWTALRHAHKSRGWYVESVDGAVVQDIDNEGLARLIAAAPELLEALERMACDCEASNTAHCYLHNERMRTLMAEHNPGKAAELEQARDAARKARGG